MKKLLVLSGKGGTGKTTVSSALISLSNAKAIADCDVDAPNLHQVASIRGVCEEFTFFGGDKAVVDKTKCIGCGVCKEKCRFNAIKIIDGKASINEYSCEGCNVCSYVCESGAVSLVKDEAGLRSLYKGEKVFSTATLKMGRGNSGKLVSEVKKAMVQNSPTCDLAIVDGSPGIGCPIIASASGMDMVLIVSEASSSGISDLKRLVKTLEAFELQIAICVNKYDVNIEKTAEIEKFAKNSNIAFVGKIPFDSMAVRAVNSGKTIVDIDCKAKIAVQNIYNEIIKIL